MPNAISAIRIALVPVFLWLLLGRDDPLAAGWLIGGIGATDWIDGYMARRLGQVSPLGKVLDPLADRLAVVAGLVAGWISGHVPWWLAAGLLAREALVAVGSIVLAARRLAPLAVRRLGKVATFAVYFAVPAFLVHAGGAWEFFRWFAYVAGIPGLVLYWAVAIQYAGDVRRALAAARVSSDPLHQGEGQ